MSKADVESQDAEVEETEDADTSTATESENENEETKQATPAKPHKASPSLVTMLWTSVEAHQPSEAPTPRNGAACAMVGLKLFVHGGWRSDGDQEDFFGDLWSFDLVAPSPNQRSVTTPSGWRLLHKENERHAPKGRWGHGCVAVNNNKTLVFVGGWPSDQLDLYSYDISANEWRQIQLSSPQNDSSTFDYSKYETTVPTSSDTNSNLRPPPRYLHSTVLYRQSLLVFGGLESVGTCHRNVWQLNIADLPRSGLVTCKEVQCTGTVPAARFGHSANVIGNVMYVFGGAAPSDGDTDIFATVFQLSLENFVWQAVVIDPPPVALQSRFLHSSFADVSNQLIFYCGGTLFDASPATDALVLSLPSKRWVRVTSHSGPFPCGLTGMSCVVSQLGQRAGDFVAFFFGGEDEEANSCNDVVALRVLSEDRAALAGPSATSTGNSSNGVGETPVRPTPPPQAAASKFNVGVSSLTSSTHSASQTVGPASSGHQWRSGHPDDSAVASSTAIHSALLAMVQQLHRDMNMRFTELERRLEETNGRVDRLRDAISNGNSASAEQQVYNEMLLAEMRLTREDLQVLRAQRPHAAPSKQQAARPMTSSH